MAERRPGVNPLGLWRYLWRAHWRDVGKRGVWKNANMVTVTGFGLAITPVFAVLLVFALIFADQGNAGQSLLMIETALTCLMAGWIVLPLLVGSVSGRGQGLELSRLQQFPFSTGQLFQVGVLASLMQPVYWILGLCSLLTLVVLGFTPRPWLGVPAGLLLVAASAVVSWAVGLLLGAVMSSRRGREFGLGVLAFGTAPIWILLLGDFDYAGGAVTFTLSGRTWLLFDEGGTGGLLADLHAWTPSAWVTDAAAGTAPVRGLLLLAALFAVSLGVAVVSLRRQIAHPPETMGSTRSRQSSLGPLPGLPVALGTATAKELRYLRRTLDALMGYVAGLVAVIWMLVRPDHGPWVIAAVMPAVVFNEMVIPLNTFGLDRGAVDRYRLWPLGDREVILSKNLAYLLLVASELAAPVLVALWRVGVPYTLGCVAGCLAVGFATMSWGNFVSVRSPAAREFFNFDSAEQAGGALPMIYSLLIWLVPIALGAALVGINHWAFLGGELVLAAAAGLLWWLSLETAARQFADHAEDMREKLAG